MAAEDRLPMQGDETLSPVDLPADPAEDRHALRWTSIAIAIAAAFLLPFNAVTLDEWANELPPSAGAARLTAVTGAWFALTERIELAAPRATLHAAWKRGEALTFASGQGAADPAPDTSPPSR
jgi:hypothetical protein